MDNVREVVVLSGVRTAIGKYGGSLKDHPPTDLAALVVREAVKRGVTPEEVRHLVFGNVIHTDVHDILSGWRDKGVSVRLRPSTTVSAAAA
jgi:acetyl-CoA C-acetyltransferase